MAPPPRTASEAGSSFGIAAWRLVQKGTVSRPGMVGIAAVLPLAITTARRAMSCSLPTATVRRSVSFPSPRKSLAPVASIAAAGRLSSRSRAIHSVRFETLGKSTAHSTREAARTRARSASLNVSPERSRVLEGMQPQYGHSPPTSSRSTTASVSPLSLRPAAIASPATPPPRHTTSNSWDNSPTSVTHHRMRRRAVIAVVEDDLEREDSQPQRPPSAGTPSWPPPSDITAQTQIPGARWHSVRHALRNPQRMILPSDPALASTRPSGENATDHTQSLCRGRSSRQGRSVGPPVSAFHNFTVLCPLAVARLPPSGGNASPRTRYSCCVPCQRWRFVGSRASHTRTALSSLQLARRVPSGENTTRSTEL